MDQDKWERSQLQKTIEQSLPGNEIKTILDFYAASMADLNECFNDVEALMKENLGKFLNIQPFGSLVTGLSLKESDIDLYMEWNGSREMPRKVLYNKINNLLRSSKSFGDVFAIRGARVPIIRCRHLLTGLSIDINVSNPKSIHNSRFVSALIWRDVRLKQLNLFLKIWAKKAKINGSGSMTSYCLCVLIIYYLQQRNLLPSIKDLQSRTPPTVAWGVNYAFNLSYVPHISNDITSFGLIAGFFKFYSTFDFESTVISPYLGYALDRNLVFSGPHVFPEYHEQMFAIERFTGSKPEPFRLDRIMCVQDPFELDHNVAKAVSKSSLTYIQQCLTIAAEAFDTPRLVLQPRRQLYDYLFFGLLEKLEQDKLQKQQQQQQQQQLQVKSNQTSFENAKHTHVLNPSTNDIKALKSNVQMNILSAQKSIYSHWLTCHIETIKHILTEIYELNMKVLDVGQKKEFPYYYMWQISTTVDTWKARNFTHIQGRAFYANQLAQTREFVNSRNSVSVDLKGYFIMKGKQDMKELRLEVRPLADDMMTMTRNGNLSRWFKSLKNFLANYSFKEKIAVWQSLQQQDEEVKASESSSDKEM